MYIHSNQSWEFIIEIFWEKKKENTLSTKKTSKKERKHDHDQEKKKENKISTKKKKEIKISTKKKKQVERSYFFSFINSHLRP